MWNFQTLTNVSSWTSSVAVRCTLYAGLSLFYNTVVSYFYLWTKSICLNIMLHVICIYDLTAFHTRWRHCASFLGLSVKETIGLYLCCLSSYILHHMLNSFSLQWWTKGGMENLHTSSSSHWQREAQTYSLQIWKVGNVAHFSLIRRGILCWELITTVSLFFTAEARQKQTTSQRELDFAMKALTNGSILTNCESWSDERGVEVG